MGRFNAVTVTAIVLYLASVGAVVGLAIYIAIQGNRVTKLSTIDLGRTTQIIEDWS